MTIISVLSFLFTLFWMGMIGKCAGKNGFIETFKRLNN